jgi:uncharacterized protein
MKVIVFGATGPVGKELVKQALYDGHEVKAYGRNVIFEGLPEDKKVELVQGALFDEGDVLFAIKGCDAVLFAVAGSSDGTDKTISLGMKTVVKQMEKAGVKRIVALGGMGVLDGANEKMLMDDDDFPPKFNAVSIEYKKALAVLLNSHLDWTLVCPPAIETGAPTGIFKVTADQLPEPDSAAINTGDLALFMLKIIKQPAYLKQKTGIAY